MKKSGSVCSQDSKNWAIIMSQFLIFQVKTMVSGTRKSQVSPEKRHELSAFLLHAIKIPNWTFSNAILILFFSAFNPLVI